MKELSIKNNSNLLKLLMYLILSLASFAWYNINQISFNTDIIQKYFQFLITEDPLFIFRMINFLLLSFISKGTFGLYSQLLSFILEESSFYYNSLSLFTIELDFMFEGIAAFLWPFSFNLFGNFEQSQT